MHVLVTGGTGFVGYHTTCALLAAGHEVTLLVRSLDKTHSLFGSDRLTRVVRGDIGDAGSVRKAVAGCDAVIHSAAVASTSQGAAEAVFNKNTEGTHTVMDAALEADVATIIYVSSITALYDSSAQYLDENSPPGSQNVRSGYGRSQIAGERYARDLQEQGAPLYITYPGSVIGPEDPGLTEPHRGLISMMAGLTPIMSSGNQYIDVRDLAQAHLHILQQQPHSLRFPLGGTFLAWRDHGKLLSELTGRFFMPLPVMPGVPRLAGKLLDKMGRFLAIDLPITEEGMRYATHWVVMNDAHTLKTLGLGYRPLRETFEATLLSLHATGHLKRWQLGALAR
ncbi:MAG: NAD-dependent epimerase/dehydratase family protein, partial [Parahaliea sp.]